MQPTKRNKILLIAGLILFVGFIFLLWFFQVGPGQKVTIDVFVVPSDAKVTVDGQPSSSTKVTLSKGTHTFKATRQYFETVTQEVDTNNVGASNTVYLALYPNSPEGEAFLAAHPDEQLRYERVSGAEFSALQEKLLDEYPVTTKLPYQTIDFKIDYDVTKKKDVMFMVTFFPPEAVTPGSDLYKKELLRSKASALEYLESQGVDVDSVEITYTPDPDNL
jgi:hypothetical protein